MTTPISRALQRLLGGNPTATPAELTNSEIAELIGSSPEALEAFSKAYQSFEEARPVSDNLFAVNSRQAAAENWARATQNPKEADSLVEQITADLLRPLELTDGREDSDAQGEMLASIERLPEAFRPQLTRDLVVKDIPKNSYPTVLATFNGARKASTPREREQLTLQAVGMLDYLDLDGVTYEMLSNNPAAMGFWLPALQHAVEHTGAFLVPETTVRKVPLPILQMTRLNYSELTPTTLAIIDAWTREAFQLDETKDYFIKTGTFSSKFDFRNAHVPAGQEVREIGQYLTYMQFQASQMAAPLNSPSPIVGVSTTNEWVVREWIEDASSSPAIYHGMPLRTEFRLFIDCDEDRVLAVAPYWDPEVMLERFEQHADADDPDMRHDAIIFRAHLPVLMERFERFRDAVERKAAQLLPHLELTGQWSLDIMLNDTEGNELYAIDMAPAHGSALSHYVPKGLLREQEVNWLPHLPELA